MPTLDQRVELFYNLDQQIKSLGKEADPIKQEIKDEMKAGGMKSVETPTAIAELSTQERTKMNEDKLVLKLKALGLTEAIAIKEVPNSEVIEQLVFEGKLAAEELASCVEVTYVDVLKVKKAKVKK